MSIRRSLVLTLLVTSLCHPGLAHADRIDDVIQAEMAKRQIPGLSLAIIEGGKIVKVKGYGVTEKNGTVAVTPATLFQAGSVSKPVAALGALHLVDQGKLTLDEDVNSKLLGWKLPENEWSAVKKVTLRGLLSHTAGLTVHGFPGYGPEARVPTAAQILSGQAPANTPPVRVDQAPGSAWRYSGGGYTLMQQLLTDVTGQPVARYLDDTVLKPLGMRDSSFAQPPAPARAVRAASGHLADRSVVKGRWHVYPEIAAAGLWTNASDLARYAIGIQQALAGTANPVISAPLTRAMLTEQKGRWGLGPAVRGQGTAHMFSHDGRNHGFDTVLQAFSETGQGAVLMINVNDNAPTLARIMNAIAIEYRWPNARPLAPIVPLAQAPDQATLDRLAGRYEFSENNMLALVSAKGMLLSMKDGLPDDEYLPVGPLAFRAAAADQTLTFQTDEKGEVTGFVLTREGRERKAPRVAPLMQALAVQADPEPARTARVKAVIAAVREAAALGSNATPDFPYIAPPRKKSPGGGLDDMAKVASLAYLGEQDLRGRAIQRHGSKVDKVVLYKVDNPGGKAYLMVHFDAQGLLADHDFVEI